MKIDDEVTVYNMENYKSEYQVKCPCEGVIVRMHDINIVVDVNGERYELYEYQLKPEDYE